MGISAATIDLKPGTPFEPFGAAKKVFAVSLEKLLAETDSVPPNVKLPVVVTMPVSVNPETLPVPLTLVTVPVVLEVPAPMAVLKAESVKALTVLSALTLRNLTAEGFVNLWGDKIEGGDVLAPQISEEYTELSTSFFEEMDGHGQQAYEDFLTI